MAGFPVRKTLRPGTSSTDAAVKGPRGLGATSDRGERGSRKQNVGSKGTARLESILPAELDREQRFSRASLRAPANLPQPQPLTPAPTLTLR